MPNPSTAELLNLIYDLKEALEFDAENCDFGPAYGIGMKRQEDALRRARSVLRQTGFKKEVPKVKARRDRFADDDIPF